MIENKIYNSPPSFQVFSTLVNFEIATFAITLRPSCTSTSRLFEPIATFLNLQCLLEGLGDPILAPQPLSTVQLTPHRSDWVFFPSRRTVGTSTAPPLSRFSSEGGGWWCIGKGKPPPSGKWVMAPGTPKAT